MSHLYIYIYIYIYIYKYVCVCVCVCVCLRVKMFKYENTQGIQRTILKICDISTEFYMNKFQKIQHHPLKRSDKGLMFKKPKRLTLTNNSSTNKIILWRTCGFSYFYILHPFWYLSIYLSIYHDTSAMSKRWHQVNFMRSFTDSNSEFSISLTGWH